MLKDPGAADDRRSTIIHASPSDAVVERSPLVIAHASLLKPPKGGARLRANARARLINERLGRLGR